MACRNSRLTPLLLLSPFCSLFVPGAVAVADHHPVTHAQLREFIALQDERHREHDDRHREHDANQSRLQRALDAKKDKRRGELTRSRRSLVFFCAWILALDDLLSVWIYIQRTPAQTKIRVAKRTVLAKG